MTTPADRARDQVREDRADVPGPETLACAADVIRRMRREPGTPGGRFWWSLAAWLDAAAQAQDGGTRQDEALEVACAYLGVPAPRRHAASGGRRGFPPGGA